MFKFAAGAPLENVTISVVHYTDQSNYRFLTQNGMFSMMLLSLLWRRSKYIHLVIEFFQFFTPFK